MWCSEWLTVFGRSIECCFRLFACFFDLFALELLTKLLTQKHFGQMLDWLYWNRSDLPQLSEEHQQHLSTSPNQFPMGNIQYPKNIYLTFCHFMYGPIYYLYNLWLDVSIRRFFGISSHWRPPTKMATAMTQIQVWRMNFWVCAIKKYMADRLIGITLAI